MKVPAMVERAETVTLNDSTVVAVAIDCIRKVFDLPDGHVDIRNGHVVKDWRDAMNIGRTSTLRAATEADQAAVFVIRELTGEL